MSNESEKCIVEGRKRFALDEVFSSVNIQYCNLLDSFARVKRES
jgi:hypothetical protein